MMLPYFIWRGIDSRTKNIVVNDYPARMKPKTRTEDVIVPGRGGSMTMIQGDDVYDSLVLPFECTALPTADIEAISAWLTGAGDLIFGNYPNRSMRARMDAQINFDKIIRGWGHRAFTVPFVCQPGRYVQPAVADIVLTEPGFVTNPGTMLSQPRITVNATGDITLTVGTSIMLIAGPASMWTLVIDSELMDCFNSSMTVLRNERMTGDFPTLQPGANAVNWAGAVSSVTIKPRWRYL